MNYDRKVIFQEFQQKKDIFENLKSTVISDLESLLFKNKICVNKVIGRIKDFDSFYQKIENMADKGQKFKSPCDEVQDIVGIRIVLLFVKDLDKIQEILKPTFKIIRDRKRFSEGRSDDQFGYESDHYVLTYNDVKGPTYSEITGIIFELQVRTVLMDAWDSLSHEIDYKNKESVPSELKRVFYGLSGLFVVADQQFQQIKESIIESKKVQDKKISSPVELLDQEINLDTLKAYIKWKFPDRWKEELFMSKKSRDLYYSEFIKEIKDLGDYGKLSDLENAVNEALTVELELEKIDFPNGGHRAIVGIFRGILDLYDNKYFESRFGSEDKDIPSELKPLEKYRVRYRPFRDRIVNKKVR